MNTNELHKETVSYDIAVRLKKAGFNEICFAYCYNNFKKDMLRVPAMGCVNTSLTVDEVALPLYQQVYRWFREKHKIHLSLNVWEDQSTEISREFYESNIVNIKDDWHTFAVGSFIEDYDIGLDNLIVAAIEFIE